MTETREIVTIYSGFSEHGKSCVFIICPFCGTKVKAYVWSLAGSGKRCTNEKCKAMLTARHKAIKELKP